MKIITAPDTYVWQLASSFLGKWFFLINYFYVVKINYIKYVWMIDCAVQYFIIYIVYFILSDFSIMNHIYTNNIFRKLYFVFYFKLTINICFYDIVLE